MADSDYDEDIKRAIALSLQESSPNPGKSEVVDLTSEDEDDDLDAPPVARTIAPPSKSSQKTEDKTSGDSTLVAEKDSEMGKPSSQTDPSGISQNVPIRENPPAANGILGLLNRKQMEEERVARANKKKNAESQQSTEAPDSRKRKASTPPLAPHNRERRPRLFQNLDEPNSSKHSTPRAALVSSIGTIPDVLSFKAQKENLASAIQYPDGVVKKTWAQGCPRQGDDIKIEEVLQKEKLEMAVLSAFQIDPDWIVSKLDAKTKVIWVLQAKQESQKQDLYEGPRNNYRYCFPHMDGGIGSMHSKLQLLSYPSHLRVVVPSGNLVPYDWGETGVMENICFLIDLPRNPDGKLTELGGLTHFGQELIHFVTAMGIDQKIVDGLRRFDYSRTANLAFVHSIGGSHTGSELKRTGYCGLGTAVQKLGLASEIALSVDLVAASIGSLNISLIQCLFLALQGDDGMTEYRWRTDKPAKGKKIESPAEHRTSDDLTKLLRIYFPTSETVSQSKGGKGAGGTICLQSKWYDGNAFPRSLMRDCRSVREGMLMHNKMILVRPHKPVRGAVAWAYVGSANLSESAWGRMVKDRTTKEPKLNCRNWECGVVIPVITGDSKSENKDQGPPGMEVFKGKIPVPMVVPGNEYAGKRPWFYTEHQ
ncbi:Tyrosyl-DNA phosphodiesterase [Lachnellula suecica]|uniref:Tyrosyl-DNA phosphodiesterase n=1 Tax=Lachnellula suecica TaxID=602035 RepID=A0A8T9C4S6_9HELO|nr:Tyrosyl-DNA phosphodiesterase [Lachnellula suecica]